MNGWVRCCIVLLLLAAAGAQAYEVGEVVRDWYDEERDVTVSAEIFYPSLESGYNVPVAIPPEGGFPGIAFGHGYLIPYTDYRYIWEELVPEGYIVMMATTAGELFPNHEQFARDLIFLVRELQARGEDPETEWYEKISSRCAVMGHAMGGGASLLAASYDQGIDAVLNLAAAETFPSAIAAAANVTSPVLMIAGELDCVADPDFHQIPMYSALSSENRVIIGLEGGTHCQFCNYNFNCEFGEFGCAEPGISRDEQQELVIEFAHPFFDFFLQADIRSWADFRQALTSTPGIDYAWTTNVSDVLLEVRADAEPVLIPANGGMFAYEVTLVNTTPGIVHGSVWTKVTKPDGGVLGPLDYRALTLPPYSVIGPIEEEQFFPGPALPGLYRLAVNAGRLPSYVVATDTLLLEKQDALESFGGLARTGGVRGLSVAAEETGLPRSFELGCPWPNPFNAAATVVIALPEAGRLRVELMDTGGRIARTLADGQYSAGRQTLTVDGADLAAGMYFIRAILPGHAAQVRKTVLVK